MTCLFAWFSLPYFVFSTEQSEVEETLKRIQSHPGVVGVVIVNQEGEGLHCGVQ